MQLHQITFVAENQVTTTNGTPVMVVGVNLTTAQAVAQLRGLHAAEGWADELDHPPYAAAHYAGLAAIEQLANGVLAHHLVPVQFGVYVVT